MRPLPLAVPLVLALGLPSVACDRAVASPSEAQADEPAHGGVVDGAQARRLVAEGAALVDVRTPGEFAEGHIEGARNVPLQALPAGAAALPKSTPLVVYCRSGRRSAAAAALLRREGYTVHDLGSQTGW